MVGPLVPESDRDGWDPEVIFENAAKMVSHHRPAVGKIGAHNKSATERSNFHKVVVSASRLRPYVVICRAVVPCRSRFRSGRIPVTAKPCAVTHARNSGPRKIRYSSVRRCARAGNIVSKSPGALQCRAM